MSSIIEASQLPEGEQVYLKRETFGRGWRVVNPMRNPDGSWNWFNIITGGSWAKLIGLIFIVGVILLGIWAHFHDVKAIQDNYGLIASNPLGWCKNVCANPSSAATGVPAINWSSIGNG